mmetsp:Transcript_2213/g.2830  ORF Transcript_2213/g.2830 Transcript_2213/m.2830 type:complete len:256 (+) Transcript_2213:236-1003(+)
MSVARVVGSANQPQLVEHEIVIPEGAEPMAGFSVAISDGRNIFVVCPSDSAPGDKITIKVPVKTSKKAPPTFYETEIPTGVIAGESFPVLLPNGVTVSIICPEGGSPGQTMRFQGPEVKSELQKMFQRAKAAVNGKMPKNMGEMQSAKDKAKGIVNEKANKAKKIMEGKSPFSKKGRENMVAAAKAKAIDAIVPAEIKELSKVAHGNDLVKPAKAMAHAWEKGAFNVSLLLCIYYLLRTVLFVVYISYDIHLICC